MASSFFHELKRRNVFKVGAGYILLSWLVLQVGDVVVPILQLPDWTLKLLLFIGIIGFPFAIFFAWVFELTPDGIKREAEVDRATSITQQTGRTLDMIIIIVLTVAVTFLITDKFLLESKDDAVKESQSYSIAVLPFVDMSPEKDNEYFSDGISEEILNILAQIREIRVIGRTSSFQFKDRSIDLRDIGNKLNVSHILEGSVRKSGDNVRITAQLVDVTDGSYLWSNTYDRMLDDIFSLQDEIANAVANSLRVNLLDDQTNRSQIAKDSEVYQLLLRARYHIQLRSAKDDQLAVELLHKALEKEPDNAEIWSDLSLVYHSIGLRESTPQEVLLYTEKQRQASDKALSLNPNLAIALSRKAGIDIKEWRFADAEKTSQKALQIAPYDFRVVANAGVIANVLGDSEAALRLTIEARKIEPLNPSATSNIAFYLTRLNRLEDAEQEFISARNLSANYPLYRHLGKVYLLQSRYKLAEEEYLKVKHAGEKLLGLAMVKYSQGDLVESDRIIQDLLELEGQQSAWKIAQIYAWRNEVDTAFEWLEKAYVLRDPVMGMRIKTENVLQNLHNDARWSVMIDKMGYPD